MVCGAGLCWLVGPRAYAAGEFCPDYQRENKALARKIKEDLKAYARSEGVPDRLMYLYDQLGDCPMCLGGDAEHPILPAIHIQYVDNDSPAKPAGLRTLKAYMTGWSADLEYEARQGMRDGYSGCSTWPSRGVAAPGSCGRRIIHTSSTPGMDV